MYEKLSFQISLLNENRKFQKFFYFLWKIQIFWSCISEDGSDIEVQLCCSKIDRKLNLD